MRKSTWFIVTGLLAALLLAGVVSNYASPHPDGLDSVAREGCTFDAEGNITGGTCMARSERDNQTKDSPLAGYSLRGLTNDFLSTGASGAIGVLLTFAIGGGVFWLLRAGKGGKGGNGGNGGKGRNGGETSGETAEQTAEKTEEKTTA